MVKLRGTGSKAALAHLRYLQRDGATLDGERGRLYSAFQDEADGSKFLDRGEDDRHQFRLIVAPEGGPELGDLRDVTRRLMAQMERDLETQLDRVAVDHHNTGRRRCWSCSMTSMAVFTITSIPRQPIQTVNWPSLRTRTPSASRLIASEYACPPC